MKAPTVAILTTQILVLLSHGYYLAQAQSPPLALDIVRASTLRNTVQSRKRAGDPLLQLDFDDDNFPQFLTDIAVGTPPQTIRVAIETKYADTYVLSSSSQICQSGQCTAYDEPDQSSTCVYLNADFSESLDYETSILGDYVTDTIAFGGTTVEALTIGVVTNTTNVLPGALGLGYLSVERATTKYPNLLVLMYNNNQISSMAYSIWVNPANLSQGQVIIGGLDTGKFLGTLESFPIMLEDLQYKYATIALSSFGIDNGSTLMNSSLPVLIDFGAPYIYLPRTLTDLLFAQLGLTYLQDAYGISPCSEFRNSTTLQFVFGSTVIVISVGDITELLNSTHCYLQIATQLDNSTTTLGLAFMRSAYVVFDFSRNQISLAQSNPKFTSDNISTISSNGVAGLVSTVPDSVANGTNNTNGVTGSGGTSSATSLPSGGLATGTKTGIGVGISLGALICGLLLVSCLLFVRKRKDTTNEGKAIQPGTPATWRSSWDKSELAVSDTKHQVEPSPRSELESPNHGRFSSNLETLHKVLGGKSLTEQPQELPADVPQ